MEISFTLHHYKKLIMKYIFTFLILLLFSSSNAQLPTTELLTYMTFENLSSEPKDNFGTQANPIQSGAFKYISDRNKMILRSIKLKNSYRWPNGDVIDFSNRKSINNGKNIVDCYTLVRKGTTDTIQLYVDPYIESTAYYIPRGLIKLNKELLAKELSPYITMIEEIERSTDPYLLKEQSAQVLQYLSQSIGIGLFNDSDMLLKPMTDEGADKDVKSFLMRAYIFNKFYALATSIDDPKDYAFSKMKSNYQKLKTSHPELKFGDLNELLK